MFNIDKYILYLQECEKDIFINLDKINPDLDEILSTFIINSNLNAIKYVYEKEIIVDEKDIMYDSDRNQYFYNFEIPRSLSTDIITNIQCNKNIMVLFHYINEIKCDINKLTLPIFNLQYCPIFLSILLDKNTKIAIKYDVYTLNNTIRETLKNNVIINNEKLIFNNGNLEDIM